jgi:hypothetical protein
MRVSSVLLVIAEQANDQKRIVEYATREQAQQAVTTLSNQNLMGRLVYVREVHAYPALYRSWEIAGSFYTSADTSATSRIERPSRASLDHRREVITAVLLVVVTPVVTELELEPVLVPVPVLVAAAVRSTSPTFVSFYTALLSAASYIDIGFSSFPTTLAGRT